VSRGDLYRVAHPSRTDPKRSRAFVVVSRQVLCTMPEYDTVICAPVSSSRHGLKHANAIHCDGLVRLPKSVLTDYVGCLGPQKLAALHVALKVALDVLD